jgi:cytidylate kinase
MKTKSRSIQQMIEEQVQKWQMSKTDEQKKEKIEQVITISREPGSGGRLVAERLAGKTGRDLFHQEVLHSMAESAKVSSLLIETLDEKGLSVLDEWISSLVNEHHLWPDEYLQHLMKVIGTIGKHGRAVLVGRGANFILPPGRRLRVRIIAPLENRIKHVAEAFDLSIEEARRRVLRTESDRKAFVRKYFHTDIADPLHYDVILNTGELTIDAAVAAILGAMEKI